MNVWALVVRQSGLPSTQRHLLRVLGEFADDPAGWPTTRQVAESAGITPKRAYLHLRSLADAGWAESVGTSRRHLWKPNVPAELLADLNRGA